MMITECPDCHEQELHGNWVQDSDIYVMWCTNCGWEDAF